MLLLDSDVMIDLLRQYSPAVAWFERVEGEEEVIFPGYVVMELIQGCRNKKEQERLERELLPYRIIWPSPEDCDKALKIFVQHRLSHNAGMLDMLIGQTAIGIGLPLYTFNDKHYQFIPGLQTIQPYEKSATLP
jgi:predicted nucleic acid-binding protein